MNTWMTTSGLREKAVGHVDNRGKSWEGEGEREKNVRSMNLRVCERETERELKKEWPTEPRSKKDGKKGQEICQLVEDG